MKLTRLKLAVSSLVMLASVGFLGVPFAHAADLQGDACAGLNTLSSGSTSTKCDPGAENRVDHLITQVVVLLSWIVGIASVIMIIIAGLKYVTAAGDANSVGSAKNTLIYALVGVIIAALAQFLVHFAFNTATSANQCKSDPTITVNDKNCT